MFKASILFLLFSSVLSSSAFGDVQREWLGRVYNAIAANDVKGLQDARNAGFDFNDTSLISDTFLGYACTFEYVESMAFIVANKGQVNLRSGDGRPAIFQCFGSQESNVVSPAVRFMVEHGADLKLKDRSAHNRTILQAASRYSSPKTLSYLLALKDTWTGINEVDAESDKTALSQMVQRDDRAYSDEDWIEPVKAALMHGASSDAGKETPALNYTFRPAFIDAGIPQMIIDSGAKRINEFTDQYNCWSPLCQVLKLGNVELLKKLLDHGAKLNTKDKRVIDLWNESTEDRYAGARVAGFSLMAQRGLLPVNWVSQNSTSLLSLLTKFNEKAGVRALIKQGADLSLGAQEYKNALSVATSGTDPEMVGILLDADPKRKLDQKYDENMASTLYRGAPMLETFLSRHFNPNQKMNGEPNGCLLNHSIDEKDALALVKLLLQYHADPNIPCEIHPEISTLHNAIYNKDLAVIQALVEAHAKIGADEMFTAAKDLSLIKYFVAHGGDIFVIGFMGQNLLHVATDKGYKELFAYLLTVPNFPIDAKSNGGGTPLYNAVAGGYLDMATELLDRGAEANPPLLDTTDDILYQALRQGNEPLIRRILSKITKIHNLEPRSYLRPAARLGNIDILNQLLNLGANAYKSDGAIHVASFLGRAPVVTLLINAGADPNEQYNWEGGPFDPRRSAMYLAFEGGDFPDVIRALVQGRAQFQDQYHAVEKNRIESVKAIHDLGGNLSDKQGSGIRRTLHIAVELNLLDMLNTLLNLGVNPNLQDLAKCGAIHYIFVSSAKTVEERVALLDILAAHQVDINSTCDNVYPGQNNSDPRKGYTALMLAAMYHADLKFLERLLQHQANPNLLNNLGQSAISAMIASDGVAYGMKDLIPIIQTLQAGGADINLAGPGTKTPLGYVRALTYLKDKAQVIQAMIAMGARE